MPAAAAIRIRSCIQTDAGDPPLTERRVRFHPDALLTKRSAAILAATRRLAESGETSSQSSSIGADEDSYSSDTSSTLSSDFEFRPRKGYCQERPSGQHGKQRRNALSRVSKAGEVVEYTSKEQPYGTTVITTAGRRVLPIGWKPQMSEVFPGPMRSKQEGSLPTFCEVSGGKDLVAPRPPIDQSQRKSVRKHHGGRRRRNANAFLSAMCCSVENKYC